MGMVWRAEHVELGTPAAVKLLDPTIAESSDALARFRREAQSAASLRSSNIVQIFDFGVDGDLPYIAMELLQGQSLAERLGTDRALSPEETAAILSQVARATAWAHSRGIVHRDLKPGNIFLSDDAGSTIVKLLDFGIAKPSKFDVPESLVTLEGTIMGTPQYMSPEQASGLRHLDHRTDIWSFGIIAFECLTGQHAFHASTLGGLVLAICVGEMPIPSQVAAVPAGFDEWFARAAHRDIEARFSTMTEAAEQLRAVCGVESPGSGRIYPYDSTLQSDGRTTGNGKAKWPDTEVDLQHTTSVPSTIATQPEPSGAQRRSRALWISASLLTVGVAIGAVGSARYASTRAQAPSARTTLHPLEIALPTSHAFVPADPSAPLVTPVPNPPTAQATAMAPARPPMGIPMPQRLSASARPPATQPNPPTRALIPVTMPSSEPRTPASKVQCDPAVKARIGFCPASDK